MPAAAAVLHREECNSLRAFMRHGCQIHKQRPASGCSQKVSSKPNPPGLLGTAAPVDAPRSLDFPVPFKAKCLNGCRLAPVQSTGLDTAGAQRCTCCECDQVLLVQAVVCSATGSLALAVALIQVGGGGQAGSLLFLVLAWAFLLPVGLLLQAVLPLPPPQGPLPYGGLTPHFNQERSDAFRYDTPPPTPHHTLVCRQHETADCLRPHNDSCHCRGCCTCTTVCSSC